MKISITPSAGKSSVVSINCGTSSPKLSGSVDISQFASLTSFYCTNNDIASLTLAQDNLNTLRYIDVSGNQITGSIPSFANNSEITFIKYNNNKLNGTIGSIEGCSKLIELRASTNSVDSSTGLTGNIPEISSCPVLQNVLVADCRLTGLPLLSSSSLRLFYAYNSTGFNSITSTLATNSLTALPALRQLQIQNQKNQSLSGVIPNFQSYNPLLNSFIINGNPNIKGEVPCTSGTNLTDFRAYSCGLSGFTLAPISTAFYAAVAGVGNPRTFRVDSNYFTLTATYYALSAFYTAFNQITARGVSVTGLTGGIFNASGTNMPKLSDAGGGPINEQIYNFVNFLTASPAPKWTITLGSSAIRG